MNIEFTIKKQIIERVDNNPIVSKSENTYWGVFNFEDEEWDNLNKFIILKDSWGHSEIVFLGKGLNTNCLIPSKILGGTHFSVTIYGGDLSTTNFIKIPLVQSGYSNNAHCLFGGKKDIFVDIFDRFDEKSDVNHIHENANNLQSGFMSSEDKIKLDNIEDEATKIIIDSELDDDSDNPVMNKVIKTALDNKSDVGHGHSVSDVSDLEDSMSLDINNLLDGLADEISKEF